MKKFILFLLCAIFAVILLVILSVPTNRKKHFSMNKMAVCDDVANFNVEINSTKEALSIFNEWLINNSDYNNDNNGITSIERYRGNYEISLETSIIINGRTTGVMGYRDYVVTKDGNLKGYYISK